MKPGYSKHTLIQLYDALRQNVLDVEEQERKVASLKQQREFIIERIDKHLDHAPTDKQKITYMYIADLNEHLKKVLEEAEKK